MCKTTESGVSTVVMRYPVSVLWIGIIDMVLFGCAVVLSNLYPGVDSNGVKLLKANPGTTLIFLGFAGLGLLLVAMYLRERCSIGTEEFAYRTFLKRGVLRWQEISSVNYSASLQWFRLVDQSGKVVHVSILFTALPEFAAAVLKRVPQDKIELETRRMLSQLIEGAFSPTAE